MGFSITPAHWHCLQWSSSHSTPSLSMPVSLASSLDRVHLHHNKGLFWEVIQQDLNLHHVTGSWISNTQSAGGQVVGIHLHSFTYIWLNFSQNYLDMFHWGIRCQIGQGIIKKKWSKRSIEQQVMQYCICPHENQSITFSCNGLFLFVAITIFKITLWDEESIYWSRNCKWLFFNIVMCIREKRLIEQEKKKKNVGWTLFIGNGLDHRKIVKDYEDTWIMMCTNKSMINTP